MNIYCVAMAARDLNKEDMWSYMKCGVVKAENQEDAEVLALDLCYETLSGEQWTDHTVTVFKVPTDMIIDAYNDLFPYEN